MSNRLRHLHTILRNISHSKRHFTMRSSSKQVSAGLIIIGDEILKGQVQDTNINHIAKHLFALGIPLQRVSVIPDDIDVIANEVHNFHEKYTFVFTSGGIGSTHDDVTFEAVGKAFSCGTTVHPELKELVWNYFKLDDKDEATVEATLKLATIPTSAVLRYGKDPKTGAPSPYPVVTVENVFVFPGIPSLFEKAFSIIKESLEESDRIRPRTHNVYLNISETLFTPTLNRIVQNFKDTVIFGSYPELLNSYYKTRISVESTDTSSLNAAISAIEEAAGAEGIVNYDPDPIGNAAQRVYSLADGDSPISGRVKSAIAVIEEAFKRYKRSEICIGFNGGKDCTALLHLVHAVHQHLHQTAEQSLPRLHGFYIRSRWPFPEVEQFIEKAVSDYNIEIIRLKGQIKVSLVKLKEMHPDIQGVFMGSRSTDPRCEELKNFSMTDPSWPQLMRINPILDWSYDDLWKFLRTLNVPYCQLYDRGYTSLGSMENTHPNVSLRRVSADGIVEYRPAYDLEDMTSERSGRG